jgi:hypothetical protein
MKSSFFKICLISLFSFSFLAGTCSSDDGETNDQMPFTPITLVMTDVTIDVDDTAFTIDGYDFSAYRAKTFSLESPNV